MRGEITDLIGDLICGVLSIVILNIVYQYYVRLIFDLALKIGG